MMGMSWVCELPFSRRAVSRRQQRGSKDGHRDFKPELYPQKHGQEDQDRLQRDPHDVGKPTPPLLYGLLAHGEFSLAQQCNGPPSHSQPATKWGMVVKFTGIKPE